MPGSAGASPSDLMGAMMSLVGLMRTNGVVMEVTVALMAVVIILMLAMLIRGRRSIEVEMPADSRRAAAAGAREAVRQTQLALPWMHSMFSFPSPAWP